MPPFTWYTNIDDSDPDSTNSSDFHSPAESFNYVVTHVFFPSELPRKTQHTPEKDLSLARTACAAAHAFCSHAHGTSASQLHRITKMLDSLLDSEVSAQSEHLDRDRTVSSLCKMQTGDVLAFLIRPFNSTTVITKQENCLLFEAFEASPHKDAVNQTLGSLICLYPDFAVEITNDMVDGDGSFHLKLANFLCFPNAAGSDAFFPPHARFIAALLSDVLRGVGHTTGVPFTITKRIRDDATSDWRRSPLWLLIKVAIQMALERSLGRTSYKAFMLFCICSIASDANIATLSTDLLHLMACKILRRLTKLGSSIPDWLSQTALKTCADIRKILDIRWSQYSTRPSAFRNPSQDDLKRDSWLSLKCSQEYIHNALMNHTHEPVGNPFYPSHPPRGTIYDFLSSNGGSFYDGTYGSYEVAFCDVEKSVVQGLDDWLASITDVNDACTQIEILMNGYMMKKPCRSPKDNSVKLLTGIELFVALDKLVTKEIPMLADYSPEVSISALESLFLHEKTSLHRLSRAYHYLSARLSRSRLGWSILSDEFIEESLPVRYFDQSPHFQQSKSDIKERDPGHREDSVQHLSTPRHSMDGDISDQSPLLASSSHTKVVVFELQLCPPYIHSWRSAAAQIRYHFCGISDFDGEGDNLLLPLRYHIDGPIEVQIRFALASGNDPTLLYNYVMRHPRQANDHRELSRWKSTGYRGTHGLWSSVSLSASYYFSKYAEDTLHTSNDILAVQANCPTDLSLDEFVTFGQLRCGGSLQWLNILHGLRSRTLNLRSPRVRFLLTCAVSQIGPLDLNTGEWTWHQDLQDTSFCNTLLEELDNLFMEVATRAIDAVMMSNISLLLIRVLASRPSEGVSERAIALLRNVRGKTFEWVQELLYNFAEAPTNSERQDILLDMAASCRSTFDVDAVILPQLLRSTEDVSAAVSCTFIIHELGSNHASLLQDCRLSTALEEILSDVILSNASDCGIDLAVCHIFPSHKPGARKWEQLQYPNTRWLTCQTRGSVDSLSQTLHLNLLNGELRVDGQPVGKLSRAVRDEWECKQFIPDQGLFVLSGMDFSTPVMMHKHKVYCFLRGDSLIVRAKCSHSKDILEWIPTRILRDDIPSALVDGHIHWLNLSTRNIEIHPLERPLEQSPENWRIDCSSGQYRAYKGHETLVDIRSPTWAMISQCFNAISKDLDNDEEFNREYKDLLITTCPIESLQSTQALQLFAALPHHGLSFFVNEHGELESRDFKNMVYDENQFVGALFGVQDLLVLRQKLHLPEELIPRRVIIPNGIPKKCDDSSHQVHLRNNGTSGSGAHSGLLYHTYDVDTELGCLLGNGCPTSTGQLAYMHATSSWDRPDPLTGKTGAQAALCLLQSAACRSIMKLKALGDLEGWISTRHPQIDVAYQQIQKRYYWHGSGEFSRLWVISHLQREAQRAACLFSWHVIGSFGAGSEKDYNYDQSDYSTKRALEESGLSSPLCPDLSRQCTINTQVPWQYTLDRLLSKRAAPELPPRSKFWHRNRRIKASTNIPELNQLFASLETNKSYSSFQQEYIAQLGASAQGVCDDPRVTYALTGQGLNDKLKKHYLQCRANFLNALATLQQRLGPTNDPVQQTLHHFGQWPPITADYLLRCLASTSTTNLPKQWKKCLVSLALLLLDVQRARRLFRFALDGLQEEFVKELENDVCDGWNPEDYPDWLLIQIQGNFLIRRVQAEIAMEIIHPKSRRNTVIQVNMGEGKSSVIIPIAAAAIADGKQLARIIVPKALTIQMFDLLVSRLGGLANRPIYHLPFSRFPEYNYHGKMIGLRIDDLHKLMSQCVAEHGILLVQPEHALSLKLMCIEEQIRKGKHTADTLPELDKSLYERVVTSLSLKLLPEDSFVGGMLQMLSQLPNHSRKDKGGGRYTGGMPDKASKWLSLQKWMDSRVRDILDESDEILHPRFQLIYTLGLEQHLDGYPDRWTTTQHVLRLVKECVHTLSRHYPDSVALARGPPGSFPHVGIAQGSDVGRRLIPLVVEHVMAGLIPNFNFRGLAAELRDAVRSFISDEDILQVPDTAKRVEEYAKNSDQHCMWSGLLLLRGLLASNIPLFALTERRWRIDYGVVGKSQYSNPSTSSTMLAVPYRAKDMPAPNSQFGHPDITIILTCLSYYNTGLSEEHLRSSFKILLDEDDPYEEYALWIKDYDADLLPDSLRRLGNINLKSSEQWDKVIFPLFSRNQATVDFYLSRVVFPNEAKEFTFKISASSWDLVEQREKVITGFSGTNDNRWLLPMSITQYDLNHQHATNAKVLAYLLRPENDYYMSGERCTTPEFLQVVASQQPPIRVLLDVGAQILDSSNLQVAKTWLEIARDAAGAVFFDENDEIMVLMRNGTVVPMLSSALSQNLGRCVVYLDHVHTRGTDIKVPVRSRAAVTLGPKLTKDRLVQGCMRMRKLDHGHSVMFFAPPEVDLSIRSVTAKKDPKAQIATVDVLCWAIHETWIDIQQRTPYWAQQGMDHKLRQDAWSRFCNDHLTSDQLSDAWLQRASKSLEELYAPCEAKDVPRTLSALDPAIRQRCKDLGVLSLPSAQMEEEHEREVNREREREQEMMELPPMARPAIHSLDPDIVAFVKTGIIPPLFPNSAFRPVFTTLEKSTAATGSEADVWSPSIMATVDFCNTIRPEFTKGTIDQYLRPVQWVLSSKRNSNDVLVLISPFEVDRLLPDIRTNEHVYLHLYAPRTSKRMKPSDDLKLYTIPPLPSDWTPPWALIDQLNVFAGQLYLRDHPSYLRLRHFLDLPVNVLQNDTEVRRNVLNIPGSFEENEVTFSRSPLPAVMALLAIRTRGRPFSHTHLGKVLHGQSLSENDFDGLRSVACGQINSCFDEETSNDPCGSSGERRSELHMSPCT